MPLVEEVLLSLAGVNDDVASHDVLVKTIIIVCRVGLSSFAVALLRRMDAPPR